MALIAPPDLLAEGEIEIDSWTELQNIGSDDSYPCGGSYLLTRDLTSQDADYAVVAGPEANFQVICSSGDDFWGIFDGQNHQIQDLYIVKDSDSASLFGDMEGATVKNLYLTNTTITGNSYYVAGLSRRTSDTVIENVHISGMISNNPEIYYCTGGLVGLAEESTTIFRSSSSASVTGYRSVGGIVGCSNDLAEYSEGVTISQSYSSGTITGATYVGGLIGLGYASVIVDSYSTSDVTGSENRVGGLAGSFLSTEEIDGFIYDSLIYNSYASGTVTAYDYVGGLVGTFGGSSNEEDPALYDSFATGLVTATNVNAGYYGGLVGYLITNISTSLWNSYWFDGYDYREDFSCFGYGEGVLPEDYGCTAITDVSEFKDTAVLTEIASAWDFDGSDAIWKTVTADYPVLYWQPEEESTPEPTPTTMLTASSNSTNSSSNSVPGANVCNDLKPLMTPDLFEIRTTKTSAKLFFTPLADTSDFYISFSEKQDAEEHGEKVRLIREGVQSHNLYHLKPNTIYYVKVRGQIGCMPGNWSNIMNFKTNNSVYYKNQPFVINYLMAKPVDQKTEEGNFEESFAKPSIIPTQVPQPTKESSSKANSPESPKRCFLWWCW